MQQTRRHVPVTMGSPRFRSAETRLATVTDAVFSAGTVLAPHTHDRAIFAVMLEGGFQSAIANRRLDCSPCVAWTEPAAEIHANYVGKEGARVLVAQPGNALPELFGPIARLLTEVTAQRNAVFAAHAGEIIGELDVADDVSNMAIDALVMSALATAAKIRMRDESLPSPPPWLARVRDSLHDHFRDPLTLEGLSTIAGVDSCYVARQFRRYYGKSIGEYVRTLRSVWAADRLAHSDMPLAQVAYAAGYSDQSHFSRQCRKHLGLTPDKYRRLHRH